MHREVLARVAERVARVAERNHLVCHGCTAGTVGAREDLCNHGSVSHHYSPCHGRVCHCWTLETYPILRRSPLVKRLAHKMRRVAHQHNRSNLLRNSRRDRLRLREPTNRRAADRIRRDLGALRVPHEDHPAVGARLGIAVDQLGHGRDALALRILVAVQRRRVHDGLGVGARQLLYHARRDVLEDAEARGLEGGPRHDQVHGVARDACLRARVRGLSRGRGGEAGEE